MGHYELSSWLFISVMLFGLWRLSLSLFSSFDSRRLAVELEVDWVHSDPS